MRTKRAVLPLLLGLALSALLAATVPATGTADRANRAAGTEVVTDVANNKWDPGKTS